MQRKGIVSIIGLVVAASVVTGLAGAVAADRGGGRERGRDRGDECVARGRQPAEIADAKLIIEFNAADGDLGVHGHFDDSGWTSLCVLDPGGRQILEVEPDGRLGDLGLGSLFFESREPPLDEFGFEELADRFPEGDYRVVARSIDGSVVAGAATFTHDVPAAPVIVSPELTDDEEAVDEVVVPATGMVVGWEPVTTTVDGGPVEISGYEVIVTRIEHDDPNGFSRPVYDVHLGPDATSLEVPDGFLEAGTAYELEVLALEVSGNQTIGLGFFTTEG